MTSVPMLSGGPLRLLLVDDHTFMRAGTRRILEDEPDFLVVGESGAGADALDQAAHVNPDVVILDIGLPDMDGIQVCDALRRRRPSQRIVVLTGHSGEALVRALHRMGVEGYFLKSAGPRELVEGIRTVAKGGRAYCDEARRAIAERDADGGQKPTRKELAVVRALGQGLRNRDIAEELQMSVNTVEFHIRNLFAKLGASTRTEVVTRARQLGWLDSLDSLC
jgi:DNA-binding NarL/FixJ family response regulator